MKIRVKCLATVMVDVNVTAKLSTRVCPHCGHPPEDFVDEETLVV